MVRKWIKTQGDGQEEKWSKILIAEMYGQIRGMDERDIGTGEDSKNFGLGNYMDGSPFTEVGHEWRSRLGERDHGFSSRRSAGGEIE